jgi:predicted PurR-regulated permease PerM
MGELEDVATWVTILSPVIGLLPVSAWLHQTNRKAKRRGGKRKPRFNTAFIMQLITIWFIGIVACITIFHSYQITNTSTTTTNQTADQVNYKLDKIAKNLTQIANFDTVLLAELATQAHQINATIANISHNGR